jgi:hypothetical protein
MSQENVELVRRRALIAFSARSEASDREVDMPRELGHDARQQQGSTQTGNGVWSEEGSGL